jgi:hypothetical protein
MVKRFASNPLEFVDSPLVLDVASVQRGGGFEEQNPAFLLGHGTVFDPARHYDKLARLDPFLPIAEFHAEAAFDYQEHFIFVIVMVEHERAVELDELHILSVEFGGDAGIVVVVNFGELFGDVDFGHGIPFEASAAFTAPMDDVSRPRVAGKLAGGRKGCRALLGLETNASVPTRAKAQSRQLFADG